MKTMVDETVQQLAIKLWLEWIGHQDDVQSRILWGMLNGTEGMVALAVEWANQGPRQREAWYDVARRAMELVNG